MIPTYLINLDRTPDRLLAMTQRLNALGIPFTRVPAVDGRAMGDDAFSDFIRTRPRNGKEWTRGKMGCFLSHQSVWRAIVENDHPYAVVLEDDLHIAESLPKIFETNAWIPEGADLVRLEPSTNRVLLAHKPVAEVAGRGVHRVLSTTWCTGAYIISKAAAQKILNVAERDHESPDHLLFCYEASVIAQWLKTYQVAPAPCIQDQFFHKFPWQIQFRSEIVTGQDKKWQKTFRAFLDRYSLPTYIRKTLQGYRRVRYLP